MKFYEANKKKEDDRCVLAWEKIHDIKLLQIFFTHYLMALFSGEWIHRHRELMYINKVRIDIKYMCETHRRDWKYVHLTLGHPHLRVGHESRKVIRDSHALFLSLDLFVSCALRLLSKNIEIKEVPPHFLPFEVEKSTSIIKIHKYF